MHKLAVVASLVAVGMSAEAGTVLRGQHVASSGLAESLSYCVYLPDGYADGTERYPTLYLLHGFGAGDNEWLDRGSIADLLDRMIADGEIGPVIAVMPDARKSWYVDSAALGGPGDYATAIQHDLVAEIDRLYRTIPRSAHRGIAGISMGGFGALRLAFSHPDEFGAVGALSAGLFMPGGVSWRNGPAGRRAEHLESWYADTFGAGFDVDLYKQKSPFGHVAQLENLADPPRVLLAAGDDDGFGAYDGTVEMFLALREIGLKPELRIFDGGHSWRLWRRMEPGMLRFFDEGWHHRASGLRADAG